MARERWEDIVAYYKTYISIIQPLLHETKRTILDLDLEQLGNIDNLKEILEEESKRKVKNVKSLTEFNAFFRNEIYRHIINYIEELKEDSEFNLQDIRDYILDFIDEALKAFDVLLDLAEDDYNKQSESIMGKLANMLIEVLFPQGNRLEDIYSQLIENSPEWYDAQRYLLQPTTFYREKIGEMTVPGLSPKAYQIVNNITSLFNLDPNFMDLEENPDFVIPTIMISDVFEPYIDSIANAEEESIKRIVQRMELQLIMGIFVGPTEKFIELAKDHKYVAAQEDSDGKTRWIPQFSNETLILLYLAKASFRRGFLSKELVNWIAMNFAFIIYNAVLHTVLSDENIFYNLFLDMKTEEKILPYLMKLLCFDKYLRLDRTKIRDSPTYRKELFNFLGGKIEAIDKLTFYLVDELEKLLGIEKED
ncbi:hypothetical protein NEF87_002186 [Candidatus Lokiarchaeum ossiferum]|uniref:Uncharacterized protein n=1 Tax=Candidatus Lokiarchaeum ossiferum TaxID=2951803 RepID=A0ABY6HTM0_9ARCH|nr:hypothetical protein NEF87_002186 [Candidatus Lokiarchaeum sp. B-35]